MLRIRHVVGDDEVSDHSNDCPECGVELCEHASNNPGPSQKLAAVKAYAEGLRIWTSSRHIANDLLQLIGEKP